jgi:hypothetical protein
VPSLAARVSGFSELVVTKASLDPLTTLYLTRKKKEKRR